jgi:hypothetical protein
MLSRITTKGREVVLDLSLMTLLELAESYGEDVTTFTEKISERIGKPIEGLVMTTRFAAIAINDGAIREGRTERVTEWDVRDMMTEDPELAQPLVDAIVKLVTGGKQVFPTAATASPKKTKRTTGED